MPGRTRHRDAPFVEAMEALGEQQRVAVSLLDRVLPPGTSISHLNK
jgi:hypothetical protein